MRIRQLKPSTAQHRIKYPKDAKGYNRHNQENTYKFEMDRFMQGFSSFAELEKRTWIPIIHISPPVKSDKQHL
jgi:hypothetical protein